MSALSVNLDEITEMLERATSSDSFITERCS